MLTRTLLGLVLLLPMSAHAALDDVLVAGADGVTTARIAEHRLRTRQRGMLKEVAGADGKVFAALWSGDDAPALLELVGPYREELEAAMRARRFMGHNVLVLHTEHLDVVARSHARHFEGHVVLQPRLPKGVTVDALR